MPRRTSAASTLRRINPRFEACIVAASGPSLSQEVAEACRGFPVIAVSDAYRLFPWADVLYSCDEAWWNHHEGCPDFLGEKWSSHTPNRHNDKLAAAERFGLSLVAGEDSDGFSFEPDVIHYGANSGFQAVNLALLMTRRRRVVLVGFDMRGTHFFGKHPAQLRNTNNFSVFIERFERAAKLLPLVSILNATPGSALTCFRKDLSCLCCLPTCWRSRR